MSVSVCVWAMLPDSNKMMIYVSWFTKNIDSLGLSCLLQFAREQCVKAIVMTPTRELCNQAAKNIAVRCIQVTSVIDRYCASVSTHSLRYSIGEYDISVCVSPPMPSNRTRRLKHMVRVDRM